MLSREEAKDINLRVKGDRYFVNAKIDAIYDSIGRCDQCIHIGELKKYCIKMQQFTPPDGYCHMYEKEIEDE